MKTIIRALLALAAILAPVETGDFAAPVNALLIASVLDLPPL